MTPRAAKLTDAARFCLGHERSYIGSLTSGQRRQVTHDQLAEAAAEYGFAPDEIRSAVDNAIKAASREERANVG